MFAFYIVGSLLLMAFGLIAQAKVKSNFHKYSKVRASSGLSGAEAAQLMLDREGVRGVRITVSEQGFLSDHYDPSAKTIRLSPEVFNGNSLAALGVACHEAGHAIQDARQYAPLVIRNAAVPMAGFGSSAGVMIVMVGLILNSIGVATIGLVLFAAVVFFQLVNLPVEFDASARAKQALATHGLITAGPEAKGVAKVLDAAALTYVAATAAAIFQLLYYAMLVFGNRR
jgi:Zn-dependent membrane protease YugP